MSYFSNLHDEVDKIILEMEQLKKRVSKLEGSDNVMVKLYIRQKGWTSAPNPEHMIGPNGRFGESVATLALEPGEYVYWDSYTVQTVDYGVVRWLQIRCDVSDTTHTADGFAWLPVDPMIVDAEALYKALEDDNTIQVDEYTKRVWDHMKSEGN